MDAPTLVLVFVGLMALAFIYAHYAPQRPSTFSEAAKRLNIGFKATAAIIGTNLTPALREAIRAAVEFEEDIAKAEETINGGVVSVVDTTKETQ